MPEKKHHHRSDSGYDLIKPVEAVAFGLLLALQVIYIAWYFVTNGASDFFKYWSCWNYLVNLVYYFVVLIGRRGMARKIALAVTPFMLGLDFLWVCLTVLIVSLGAATVATSSGSDGGGYTLKDVEELLGMAFVHFCPVIAVAAYYGFNVREVRHVYRHAMDVVMKRWRAIFRILTIGSLLWLPWLFFTIYTFVRNPVVVYGYAQPSTGVMLGLEAAVAVLYSAVMCVVMFFMFSRCECGKSKKKKTEGEEDP